MEVSTWFCAARSRSRCSASASVTARGRPARVRVARQARGQGGGGQLIERGVAERAEHVLLLGGRWPDMP